MPRTQKIRQFKVIQCHSLDTMLGIRRYSTMQLLLRYMVRTRKFNIVPVLILKKRIFEEIIAKIFHLRIYVMFHDRTCGSFAVKTITIGGEHP